MKAASKEEDLLGWDRISDDSLLDLTELATLKGIIPRSKKRNRTSSHSFTFDRDC